MASYRLKHRSHRGAAPKPGAGKHAARRRCGKRRCRIHGGAAQSGAPRGNRNARKHGRFTGDAIAERKQIQALLGEARKLLQEMK